MKNIILSKNIKNALSKKYGINKGGDFKILPSHLILNIDFSVDNLNAGAILAFLNETAFFGKRISDIQIQFSDLNTNISFGILRNFKIENLKSTDTSISVNDADAVETFFSSSIDATNPQDTLKSVLNLTNADYKFQNNEILLIKNTGLTNITTGKLRAVITFYENII